MLGYDSHNKAYRLQRRQDHKIFVSRDVHFIEHVSPSTPLVLPPFDSNSESHDPSILDLTQPLCASPSFDFFNLAAFSPPANPQPIPMISPIIPPTQRIPLPLPSTSSSNSPPMGDFIVQQGDSSHSDFIPPNIQLMPHLGSLCRTQSFPTSPKASITDTSSPPRRRSSHVSNPSQVLASGDFDIRTSHPQK